MQNAFEDAGEFYLENVIRILQVSMLTLISNPEKGTEIRQGLVFNTLKLV